VVVGSRHDQAASEVVEGWAPRGAALLTCEDLSTRGWRYRPFDRSGSRAVVGGRVIREGEIRGVLVRRPWIVEQELAHVRAPDREYVAAEMNAFLVSWLASLRCRVLNRPSGTSLCGPNWRPLQWAEAAARAGIPVEKTSWRVPAPRWREARAAQDGSEPLVEVTLVGERCLGAPGNAYVAASRRLAAVAKVGLLGVRFEPGEREPRFVSATAMPSLKDPRVARAVRDYLLGEPAAGEPA
jgi:hypothetical protein